MKRARYYFPAALLLVALVVVPSLLWEDVSAQDKGKDKVAAATVKWEYKVLQSGPLAGHIDADKMEKDLNELGQDRWECVGAVSEVYGFEGNATRALLICKRPKR